MKRFILFIILLIATGFFLVTDKAEAQRIIYVADYNVVYAQADYYRSLGYSCAHDALRSYRAFTTIYICTGTVTNSYISSYGAYQNDYRTLTGYANYTTTSYGDSLLLWSLNTPFLYLQNPPEGTISVNIDSERDKYYPKPDFNQENGWLVESKDNKISIDGEEKDNLFYELETSKITLNRNGKNFSSKDEIIDYLENSDFLTKLGFSEIEKKNSLEYFIPKLKEAKDQNYYYLTILSDKSVGEISDLNINPKPENIIRQYFAVYPTAVPVKTEGEFKFTENKNTSEFTAKETGEFLIEEPMQVFFE